MSQLNILVKKMHTDRAKELKKDQRFVEKGGEYSDEDSDEPPEEDDNEYGDDDDDSEDEFYEDDTSMYKSRIDGTDELITLKSAFEHIY